METAVVGVEPQQWHAGGLFDFAGFALAKGLVFQQRRQFALIDAGFGRKAALLAAVQACDPAAQIVAAQFGCAH